jgi:hypothetical protein
MKAKALKEIRLLPPLAVSRLGSSPEPVNNYDLVIPDDQPLGYRQIVPAPTLVVDEASGRIVAREVRPITFKDEQGRIRPVAPFLELWGRTGDADEWEHLTADALGGATLQWRVHVGNIKVFRRTGDPHDCIEADSGWFSDHARRELRGVAKNFFAGRHIALGHIQFIDPTRDFPHIRARYTPAGGFVYGSSPFVQNADGTYANDPNFKNTYLETDPNIREVVYDPSKGKWLGYDETLPPNKPQPAQLTIPPQIYAGQSGAANGSWVSKGYLDDECDGTVEVELTIGKTKLSTFARIGAGPPAFAPDSYPIRSVYDELEQALLGPEVKPGDYTSDELQHEAEEILRRAFETVRLMSTTIMNGNAFRGQVDIGSTMVRQDHNDAARAFEPIMAPTIVDNLAVRTLHQNVFTALRSGAPPWFVSVLRKFDEIGDLTDLGRRKMPGMMRNADGRHLCLTRRQREKIRMAAARLVSPAEEEKAR